MYMKLQPFWLHNSTVLPEVFYLTIIILIITGLHSASRKEGMYAYYMLVIIICEAECKQLS